MSASGSKGQSEVRNEYVPDNRLVDNNPSDRPDELDGEKGAQDLHPVIAKAVLRGGLPPRHPDCKEGDGKTCMENQRSGCKCYTNKMHDLEVVE
jgi:hypothetical protein